MGVLDDGERVVAADAAAWRAWLQDNHASSKGAWLVRGRPGFADRHVDYETAILQALCFGWIDGPVRTFDEETGGLWFAPRRASSGWAATNKARVLLLEESGEMTDAGRRAIAVAQENGAWTVLDNAEAGVEPADLAAALDASPPARASWDAFPRSAKKLGITQVDSARRPETRAARIARIVEDAAAGRRPA